MTTLTGTAAAPRRTASGTSSTSSVQLAGGATATAVTIAVSQ